MTISIAAVGDICLGDYIICLGFGVRSVIEKERIDIFREVKDALLGNEIVFGNLECVLSDRGKDDNNPDTLYIRGKSEFVHMIKSAGFNVLNIANNHIMQHGESAYQETKETLDAANIIIIGEAERNDNRRTTLKIKECNGMITGFLAYNMVPELYCNEKQNIKYAVGEKDVILEEVKKCSKVCDHLIVSLHWGLEYLTSPSVEMRTFAHAIIDNGARIILGHHPHTLQGIERFKDGLVVYSLGNFVFDLVWHKACTESMIIKIVLDKERIVNVSREYIKIDIKKYVPRPFDNARLFKKLDKKVQQYADLTSYLLVYKIILMVLFFKKIYFMLVHYKRYSNVFKRYFIRKKILGKGTK